MADPRWRIQWRLMTSYDVMDTKNLYHLVEHTKGYLLKAKYIWFVLLERKPKGGGVPATPPCTTVGVWFSLYVRGLRQLLIRPRPHVSGYFRKRRFFSPYSKTSASTRTVLQSYLPVHTYTRKCFEYARLHMMSMRRLLAHARCEKHKPAKIKEFAAIFVLVLLVLDSLLYFCNSGR